MILGKSLFVSSVLKRKVLRLNAIFCVLTQCVKMQTPLRLNAKVLRLNAKDCAIDLTQFKKKTKTVDWSQ
jgi:hypothetical protein